MHVVVAGYSAVQAYITAVWAHYRHIEEEWKEGEGGSGEGGKMEGRKVGKRGKSQGKVRRVCRW